MEKFRKHRYHDFDLSSQLIIDFAELEVSAIKFDRYYNEYEMTYKVKRLKEAISDFNSWFRENYDKIEEACKNYKIDRKEDKDGV